MHKATWIAKETSREDDRQTQQRAKKFWRKEKTNFSRTAISITMRVKSCEALITGIRSSYRHCPALTCEVNVNLILTKSASETSS